MTLSKALEKTIFNLGSKLVIQLVCVLNATHVFKETVNYYRTNGSYVFSCFVDFSKAFDNVNYWKLFSKLINDNVDNKVLRILAFWYSNQECRVRWSNVLSETLNMSNGTRQGGILSLYSFTKYIQLFLLHQ